MQIDGTADLDLVVELQQGFAWPPVAVAVEARPGNSGAERIHWAAGDHTECSDAEPDISGCDHRPRVVDAQLNEPRDPSRIALPAPAPQPLRGEGVGAVGSVLSHRTLPGRERSRLVPGANGEGARQIAWPEQPGGSRLADLEPVAAEPRPDLQASLLTARDVAVVAAEGEVKTPARRDRRGDAVGRVVIAGKRA